ncbi:MAG: hypothetical protein AB7U85_03585 [Alphaproteobacteria bacterium]
MKFCLLVLCPILMIASCKSQNILEKNYLLQSEADKWAKKADIKDLCRGLKSWRNEEIRNASMLEMQKRNIDTTSCYAFEGYELSTTFSDPKDLQ